MLTAIIVGGGIAGFSAAISLRRAGHEVHLYEQSSFTNEVGAAINVPPNASRALLAWGLDPWRAKFITAKRSMTARGDTLEIVQSADLTYMEQKFGAPFFFAHRVDLHNELKILATGEGEGHPVVIHLNAKVVDYVSPQANKYLMPPTV